MSDFDSPPSVPTPPLLGTDVADSDIGGNEGLEPQASPVVESSTALAVRPSSLLGRPGTLTLQRLSQLKELYYSYESIESITKIMGMSHKTIQNQLNKPRGNGLSWKQERAAQQKQMTDTILDSADYLLRNASDKAFRLLHIGLDYQHKQMAVDPSSMTLADLDKVASIAEKVDKLNRLAAGRATDIHSMVSQEKTDEIIKKDPFTSVEVVVVSKDEPLE